jgi:hypothetical protein
MGKALDRAEGELGGAVNVVVNCAGIAVAQRVLGKKGPHSLDAFLKVCVRVEGGCCVEGSVGMRMPWQWALACAVWVLLTCVRPSAGAAGERGRELQHRAAGGGEVRSAGAA